MTKYYSQQSPDSPRSLISMMIRINELIPGHLTPTRPRAIQLWTPRMSLCFD
ncbi:hypothetical protein SAMN05216308_12013 [Nitrosospira sp. Nsp13]|nr:hypothetical protein SAMN05216308_12013 [Nitrosospira sp. Nsp13]